MSPWKEPVYKPRTWSQLLFPKVTKIRTKINLSDSSKYRYLAVISLRNCGNYEWKITAQGMPLKSGVCRSLERAQSNCDRFLKKKLKCKLLQERHIIFA
jgi:hypothetical protein